MKASHQGFFFYKSCYINMSNIKLTLKELMRCLVWYCSVEMKEEFVLNNWLYTVISGRLGMTWVHASLIVVSYVSLLSTDHIVVIKLVSHGARVMLKVLAMEYCLANALKVLSNGSICRFICLSSEILHLKLKINF